MIKSDRKSSKKFLEIVLFEIIKGNPPNLEKVV